MPRALPREWFGGEIRNAGVRRERPRLGRGTLLAWGAATLLLLGCLLLYVTQGIQVIRMGYEIDRQQNRLRVVKAERERLEVELASLQELATVQRQAVERLGMVFPQAGQVVVVRASGASRPTAAAAPPATALAAARRE
jgi:cell division protein FtsL